MSDQVVLLVAAATLYVPGALVLLAARVASPAALLGLAPLLTLGVIAVSAYAGQVLGVDYEWIVLALVGVAAVAAAGQLIRHRPGRPTLDLSWLAGLAVALVGVALAGRSWLRGFGGLATPPQEHDTITHTMVTSFIARTGLAGPGEIQPTDLLSGEPVRYYPAGFHSFAALLTHVAPDAVVAVNAATIVLCAVAAPLGLFAVASRIEGRASAPLFAGLVALFGALLFRPAVELAHDAGILAFAAGVSLLPGFALAMLALRGRTDDGTRPSDDVGGGLVLALAALALLTVHPSVLIAATLSAVLVLVLVLASAEGRTWLRSRLSVLSLAAGAGLVVALPWLISGAALGGQVASFPETPTPAGLGDAVLRVAQFAYGPSYDIKRGPDPELAWDLHQTAFAALFWVGLIGCLTSRRLRPLVLVWGAWAAQYALWASGGDDWPVIGQVADIFYNSANRMLNLSWVVAPAVAGLGLGALALLAGRVARRTLRAAARIPARPALAALVVLAAAGYVVGPGEDYAETNRSAVAARWGQPQFIRISGQDRQAFGYLAGVRQDVGRVLNNANDGSTYLYVYTGLPVVNVYPVGLRETQYGIYLMQYFNLIDTSPQVRCLVRRWDITHVFVSRSSPSISNIAAPDGWTGPGRFSYAPGLADLDEVDAVTEVFGNADAQVYRIDPEVARTADLGACSADPGVAPPA